MVIVCTRYPCSRTTSGYCPECDPVRYQQPNTTYQISYPGPLIPPPGCICPPTCEQTCMNRDCPRRPPSSITASQGRPAPKDDKA
jgi:hypothetical protein